MSSKKREMISSPLGISTDLALNFKEIKKYFTILVELFFQGVIKYQII